MAGARARQMPASTLAIREWNRLEIALGTPTTTAEFSGTVYYYISQTRKQALEFMRSKIIDQRVLAIYFDSHDRVARIAEYGLQDGQLFDFVTATTPTNGEDLNFVQQVLRGVLG